MQNKTFYLIAGIIFIFVTAFFGFFAKKILNQYENVQIQLKKINDNLLDQIETLEKKTVFLEEKIDRIDGNVELLADTLVHLEEKNENRYTSSVSSLHMFESRVSDSFSLVDARFQGLGEKQETILEDIESYHTFSKQQSAEMARLLDIVRENTETASIQLVQEKAPQSPEEDLENITGMALGHSLYKEQKYGAAAREFQAILENDQNNVEARLYLAASLYYENPGDSSRYNTIRENLQTVLEENISLRQKKEALNISGLLFLEEQDWTEAAQYFEQLYQLEPLNSDFRLQLGLCNLFNGEYAEAQSHLSFVAEKNTDDTELQYYAGLSFYYNNDFGNALTWFLKCTDTSPNFFAGVLKTAEAYQALGNYLEALEHYKKFASFKKTYEVLKNSAVCYRKLDMPVEAEEHWKMALSLSNGRNQQIQVYENLVDIAWEQQDYTKSISYAAEGLDKTGDPSFVVHEGRGNLEIGNEDLGKSLLNQIVSQYPNTEYAQNATAILASYEQTRSSM